MLLEIGKIKLSNMELTRILLSIGLILIFAHSFGYIFKKLTFPKVIGEIVGGIILGPTILGFFFKNGYNWIFNGFHEESKMISMVHWIGLILLMLISGFNIQTSFNKNEKKEIYIILFSSMIIPFLIGLITPNFYGIIPLLGAKNNITALKIIIAIAVSLTSIPVISRIFIDLTIINTNFAKIVLTASALKDIILWVALIITTGLASAETISSPENIILHLLAPFTLFVIVLFILPRLIKLFPNLKIDIFSKSFFLVFVFPLSFIFVAILNYFYINVILGALLLGVIFKIVLGKRLDPIKNKIEEFSLAFFIPIYFGVVGLKLDLINHFNILFFLGFFLFSTIVQMGSVLLVAKLIGKDWFTSLNIAFAMNTRGGPGIILATIALESEIINLTFFSTLVMNSIITSFIAGWWFKLVFNKGWPLMNNTIDMSSG